MEGPEVRRIADRLVAALVGQTVVSVDWRHRSSRGAELVSRLEGSEVTGVETYGKHLVVAFSSGVWLRNHMMMTGAWRVGDANASELLADRRVRVVIAAARSVAVELNGPILELSRAHPSRLPPIADLGPDALKEPFPVDELVDRASVSDLTLADLLLEQRFVAGVGNKYKSEILFIAGLDPSATANALEPELLRALLELVPRVLRTAYEQRGSTRPPPRGAASRPDQLWVYRRPGRACPVCGAAIVRDRRSGSRVTFSCPRCRSVDAADATARIELLTGAGRERSGR